MSLTHLKNLFISFSGFGAWDFCRYHSLSVLLCELLPLLLGYFQAKVEGQVNNQYIDKNAGICRQNNKEKKPTVVLTFATLVFTAEIEYFLFI